MTNEQMISQEDEQYDAIEDEITDMDEDISDIDGESDLPEEDGMDSEDKVRMMATAADDVKAMDIVALDLRGITIIADFFLIVTGNSGIQIRAIADRIEEKLKKVGISKYRIEGEREASWILIDFGDVVVHVMAAEQRAYYKLEKFWSAAPRMPLGLEGEPAADAEPDNQEVDNPNDWVPTRAE